MHCSWLMILFVETSRCLLMVFISMTFFLGHSALDYGQFWVDSLSFHIVLNIYNFTSTLEGYGFRIAWKCFWFLLVDVWTMQPLRNRWMLIMQSCGKHTCLFKYVLGSVVVQTNLFKTWEVRVKTETRRGMSLSRAQVQMLPSLWQD